jgi:SagB-type dehydrogenase family enzyme
MMELRYRLVCAPGAQIVAAGRRFVDAHGARGWIRIDLADTPVRAILANLHRHDVSETELHALALAGGGKTLEAAARQWLAMLKQAQALSYEVAWENRTLARVLPLSTRVFADRKAGSRPGKAALDAFACLRAGEQGVHVLAPGADAEVIVDPRLAGDFVARTLGAAKGRAQSPSSLALLQHVLHDARLLAADREGGRHANGWSFPDLLFHANSSLSNGWGPFGKRRHADPEESFRPRPARAESVFPLPGAPPLKGRPAAAFAEVLGGRRSLRRPGPRPLSLTDLSGFLSLAAAPRRGGGTPGYPYPSGGGIYAFSIYIAVRRCSGLQPGLYRYEAESHRLHRLEAPPEQAAALAAHGGRALGLADEDPDAVLVVTAEIGRLQARYAGIAYRLALTTAGCLIQNMYLAASALGLAGCALGAGRPLLFAAAAGLDPWSEPSLADFALSGSTR